MTLVTAILAIPSATVAQTQRTQAQASTPTVEEISRALAATKADPNLATSRTVKSLQWNAQPAADAGAPAWTQWIAGFARWLTQSARLLMWVVILGLLSALAVVLVRLRRHRLPGASLAPTIVAPTHVRELDIRPDTLPEDVGAAARSLWDRGEPRAALSLLYRGLLSRLAHVHRMSMRESSTEGDCLRFSRQNLAADSHEYVSTLITVWQRSVYGREQAGSEVVYALCDGFSRAIDTGSESTS